MNNDTTPVPRCLEAAQFSSPAIADALLTHAALEAHQQLAAALSTDLLLMRLADITRGAGV